jgi:thymidylate synthase
MKQYIELLKDVMENGVDKPDRTSVGNSRAVFGRQLRFNLADGFPIITTRKVPLRIAFEETMFFLRGHTDTKLLEEKKINIWKGNTSREFLDSRGLKKLSAGDMGKGYGYQWRHWETPVIDHMATSEVGYKFVYEVGHTDQIVDLLQGLKRDPYGRRHVVTGWNPGQLHEMALPPCHMLHMYSVDPAGKLHTSFVMRSNDVPYGLPFNIMGYALLNHIFAQYLGLTPGELVYMGWDVHIYANQFKMVEEQLTRDIRSLPNLKINKALVTIDDIMNLQWTDIELIGYDPHPDIADKPEMAT